MFISRPLECDLWHDVCTFTTGCGLNCRDVWWNSNFYSECRVLFIPQRKYRIVIVLPVPTLSCFPSFSLPDVLCDPTDIIWWKGTLFEAMTGRTAPSADGLLAEVFWGFPRLQGKCQDICAQPPGSFHYHPIISDRHD